MAESPYPDLRREALAALAAGDPQRAFSLFRCALEYPGVIGAYEAWQDALRVFAQIAAAIAEEEFAEHVERAARDPDDADALHALGAQLIDQSLHGIAATVLARANALEPGCEEILLDLVGALEGSQHHHDACRALREAGRVIDESFACRYLLAHNALMTGDLTEPRRLLPALSAMAQHTPGPDGSFALMAAQVRQMLARAEAVSDATLLDEQDLRGWHFIVNGGLLLHLSPYGFHEGMSGRYAFTQDTAPRCREALARLDAVLAAWGFAPPRVYALPDRDSVILAHAAGRVLGVPVEPWPYGGAEAPGLIVAYDLDGVAPDALRTLRPHRPGQLLFCHAACWTAEPPFVADITTYLYQTNKAPWEPRARPTAEGLRASSLSEEASILALAAKVASTPLEAGALADLPALIDLATAIAKLSGDAAAGAFQREGNRRRQRKDSPVKSSQLH